MGILHTKKEIKDEKTMDFHSANPKNLLLIFTRNPQLGKCKTRLASKVGDVAALEIYKFLLNHTVEIAKDLFAKKIVYYSEEIWEHDIWDNTVFEKRLQKGTDLGIRMENAFTDGFKRGFEKILVIGSDMFDLSQSDIENAFLALEQNDFVIGPAEDGGYYLLGMKKHKKILFHGKDWGKETVLADTVANLKGEKLAKLPLRNDIDHYEDIQDNPAFEPFLKHMRA